MLQKYGKGQKICDLAYNELIQEKFALISFSSLLCITKRFL